MKQRAFSLMYLYTSFVMCVGTATEKKHVEVDKTREMKQSTPNPRKEKLSYAVFSLPTSLRGAKASVLFPRWLLPLPCIHKIVLSLSVFQSQRHRSGTSHCGINSDLEAPKIFRTEPSTPVLRVHGCTRLLIKMVLHTLAPSLNTRLEVVD